MFKNKKNIITMAFFVLSIVIFVFGFYLYSVSSVSSDTSDVVVTIESGSIWSVGSTLKSNHLIKNRFWFYFYCRASGNTNLMAATYTFNESMNVKEIVSILTNGKKNEEKKEEISITFREGINIREVVSLISKYSSESEEYIYSLLEDRDYLNGLIDKYWFIDDSILNDKLFYSLEGYLYPDTYNFYSDNVNSSDVINKMLDKMGNVLNEYKSEIDSSKYSVHELLTLSSIVEKEVSNVDDRRGVAGLFYNRLNRGISLGSDASTFYANKIDDWSIGLTKSQLADCSNPYNTRCVSLAGLPVGPIGLVGKSSIDAVMKPDIHDYLFFVNDCDGAIYYSKTDSENINNKNRIIKENNWCG